MHKNPLRNNFDYQSKMVDLKAEFLRELEQGRESLAKVESLYEKWAEKFDEVLIPTVIATNKYIAELLCKYLSNKTDSIILDASCGTGFTGLQIYLAGFKNIDGTDFSEGMMKQARRKNIYRNLFEGCITEISGLDCEDNIYDAFISCFGISQGHMALSHTMREALRVVKKNGVIVITINPNLGRKHILNEITRLVNEDKVLLKSFEDRFYYEDQNVNYYTYFCVMTKL